MRVLHLIRHGPVVVDLARPSSQWELSPGALETITPLARAVRSAGFRRVVTSDQRKAVQTARVLAEQLGAPVVRRPGLEEHHRLEEQRIDSAEAFHKTISEFFARSTVVVFGTESASMALERFHRAVQEVMMETDNNELIVSHGTVISLLLERGGNGPAFSIWRSLRLPDHVMLEWPTLRRINV